MTGNDDLEPYLEKMNTARTLLLVDGDPEARAAGERLFAQRGFEVESTGSAEEAARLLRSRRYTCAVVDVCLEDCEGLEAVESLREICPGLPVVVTAAENSRELEARVRRKQVAYYHVKEFDPEELAEAVEEVAGRARMGGKRRKILIVDDDRDYQAAMAAMLESSGYEVVQAYTKDKGLEAAESENPDLIILDIMMTGTTDGFHFVYELQSALGKERPPVLSISVISEKTGLSFSPTEDGDYFPVDDFMSKPVDRDELVGRVEKLLAGGAGGAPA